MAVIRRPVLQHHRQRIGRSDCRQHSMARRDGGGCLQERSGGENPFGKSSVAKRSVKSAPGAGFYRDGLGRHSAAWGSRLAGLCRRPSRHARIERGAGGSRTHDGGFAIRCLSHLATAPYRIQFTLREFGLTGQGWPAARFPRMPWHRPPAGDSFTPIPRPRRRPRLVGRGCGDIVSVFPRFPHRGPGEQFGSERSGWPSRARVISVSSASP